MSISRWRNCRDARYLQQKQIDLVGFSVGVVTSKKILKKNIKSKDIIIAFPSSGLHSNGFSLVRDIIAKKE